MVPMKTVTLNRFDGGVSNDPKIPSGRHARAVANFNLLTDPYRLIPYVSSEDGDSSASSNQIRNFTLGKRGSTPALFGLGINGSNQPAVFYRDIASDLEDATWSTTANNSIGGTQYAPEFFIYYPNQDKVYYAYSSTAIAEYDPDTPSTNQSADLASSGTITPTSFTRASNAIIHSKDDTVYVGLDNYLIKKNGSTAWSDALTLPVGSEIVTLCEYGNFLAIGVRQTIQVGKCTVYLWDRDSSLTTLSESISWGDEDLRVLEEVEGELVGISMTGDTASDTFEKVIFRKYTSGVGAVKFLELNTGHSPSVSIQLVRSMQQKYRGRLFFMMTILINGSARTGVWSIGRNSRTQEWVLVHERTSDNDTGLNATHTLRGFFNVGDYLFQSHQDNGTYEMTKTSDQEAYSATSYYETTINPGMPLEDVFRKKKLYSVTCHYEPQPANGQVVVKYRTDRAAAYTTIFTDTTNNSNSFEMVDAGGTPFTDGREFEFRIESTGGTVITGLTYKYEDLETNI